MLSITMLRGRITEELNEEVVILEPEDIPIKYNTESASEPEQLKANPGTGIKY